MEICEMVEIWSKIRGFPSYEVSSLGRVRSLDRKTFHAGWGRFRSIKGRLLKPRLHKQGYVKVVLCKDGEEFNKYIHRLVAETFLINPENKAEVNHKNGVKSDNKVTNLEWVSRNENIKHSVSTGLLKNPHGVGARNFKGLIEVYKDGVLIDTLAGKLELEKAGFHPNHVYACLRSERKSHKGCTFKRKDA